MVNIPRKAFKLVLLKDEVQLILGPNEFHLRHDAFYHKNAISFVETWESAESHG